MAWTTAQEKLIGDIIAAEIIKRLEANQTSTVAMIFDPGLPNAAKNLLKNRLNAMKTADQAELAALPQRQLDAAAFFNGRVSLIDSILLILGP